MRTIPTLAPDVEAQLIGLADSLLPDRSYNVKPATTGAYQHYVLRADLQQKLTPISRYCRVSVQAWAVDGSGRSDIGAAFDMANAFGHVLEGASRSGFLLNAEVESGPLRVADDVTRQEYSLVTLLLEVAV